MATPESKVKKRVVDVLKGYGIYHFYPVTSGYGRSGVPDIVGCWRGRFIGIECKAKGGKPTALQTKNLVDIANEGGVAIIVDEDSIGVLVLAFETWHTNGIPPAGRIFDWTEAEIDWEAHKKPTV